MTSDLLKLAFGRPSQPPDLPPTDAPGVNVWRDSDERVIAWGHSENGLHWMHWPRLASFCFSAAGNEITAFPAPGVRPTAIHDTWLRSVVPMAMQALGREALHASAVISRGGVVAFCAQSHTGKSTLAFGLSRRGYRQWADDAVVIDMQNGSPLAIPLPFRVRLREPSAAYYQHPERRGSEPVAVADGTSAPLVGVCILDRRSGDDAKHAIVVERLQSGAAFVGLLTHAYCFNPAEPLRRAAMLQHYLDMPAAFPVFRLTFPADMSRLPELMDEADRMIQRIGDGEGSRPCAL